MRSSIALCMLLVAGVPFASGFMTKKLTESRHKQALVGMPKRFSTGCPLNMGEEGNNDNDGNNKQQDDPEQLSFQERLDKTLDTPFFDPDEFLKNQSENNNNNNNPLLLWFANLVQNDYATAEALFAGVFFVVLVVLTQEALRLQMYGDAYVAFKAGGGNGGSLFH